MKYTYLYQDKNNRNCTGEIEARNREDAYTRLRKSGIRPYRVIGDDPFDWRPLVFWGAVTTAFVSVIASAMIVLAGGADRKPRIVLSDEEAVAFRRHAEEAVERAPSAYRYNVWRGVNARLAERGLEPIPKPIGLVEEDFLLNQ